MGRSITEAESIVSYSTINVGNTKSDKQHCSIRNYKRHTHVCHNSEVGNVINLNDKTEKEI